MSKSYQSTFWWGVICFAICAPMCLGVHAARAQSLQIDSLFVNESAGRLLLWGDFGLDVGNVYVDGKSLLISSWQPSLIVAQIPDTGAGSIGPVHVVNTATWGESKTITQLKAKLEFSFQG